ncbi:tetratricopeptide repeat protein [Nostoc sp. TCL26-01]|uniref:tetratricopeptide repeat protein n=1 Tax=Nostoc sp. TCL26-01 TaxID=2576904 RepID=UPI0015B98A6D|nr:tetratricopeptide repeat protein [Nostoc sp. TCL26-01]QLE57285.1 tetratricopeptide repeat protein [Nostoc sp. TCL26-01]
MKFYHELVPVILSVSVALVPHQIANALPAVEVAKIAKSITVLIDNKDVFGSGVIIKQEGNTYTVLTAQHVVSNPSQYEIVTPDNQHYSLNYNTVKKLPAVDLAVVQFTSNQTYAVAKIGNSDDSIEGTTAYVSGFPRATAAINNKIYTFVDGLITANAAKPLKDGYALVYSNNTLPGMSGGPLLNENGELIGIHGRGDEADIEVSQINSTVAYVKSGFNLGIPINTFLRLSANIGIDVGVRPPNTPVATVAKADDFYIQGGDKYKKGDMKGSVADYTQAIRINFKYVDAYNNRGVALANLNDHKGAIEDYNQALNINPRYGNAYNNRGVARANLGDKKAAIEDFNQAIQINPNDANAYYNRGIARSDLGDKKGAIEDYNQAIKINPIDADTYTVRGVARADLGDKRGAIEDYNQALKINPNLALAYNNRGLARSNFGDKKGAIEDYNQALKINSNLALVYNNRGLARGDLGDKTGAIEDYNQALKIDPNLALAYNNRGVSRYQSGDKNGAIADFNQALKINPHSADVYNNRGLARSDLGDKKEAIEDYNQALKINFNYADAYYNRGITYYQLKNKQAAIADLEKAASLYIEQGKIDFYQETMQLIKRFQQ